MFEGIFLCVEKYLSIALYCHNAGIPLSQVSDYPRVHLNMGLFFVLRIKSLNTINHYAQPTLRPFSFM